MKVSPAEYLNCHLNLFMSYPWRFLNASSIIVFRTSSNYRELSSVCQNCRTTEELHIARLLMAKHVRASPSLHFITGSREGVSLCAMWTELVCFAATPSIRRTCPLSPTAPPQSKKYSAKCGGCIKMTSCLIKKAPFTAPLYCYYGYCYTGNPTSSAPHSKANLKQLV